VLLVAGYWLLVTGCWLLVAGCYLSRRKLSGNSKEPRDLSTENGEPKTVNWKLWTENKSFNYRPLSDINTRFRSRASNNSPELLSQFWWNSKGGFEKCSRRALTMPFRSIQVGIQMGEAVASAIVFCRYSYMVL